MNNSITRSISGLVFLILMTGGIFFHSVIYAFLMLFIILVMEYEYLSITGLDSRISRKERLFLYLSSIILFSSFFAAAFTSNTNLLYVNVFSIYSLYILNLFVKNRESKDESVRFEELTGVIIYTALPFSITSFILFPNGDAYNPALLFSMFVILWSSDVGAYIFGMTMRKLIPYLLFPTVSPKKTWIGAIGGLTMALITGYLLNYYGLINFNLIHTFVITIIINIFGVLGDLLESKIKRSYGVKDSGKIMPGHGGLLDRFDGALVSFPIAVAYIKIFNLL